MALIVYYRHPDVGDMLVTRGYPRPDHLDPYRYRDDERELAEARAANLRAAFPGCIYIVKEEPCHSLESA